MVLPAKLFQIRDEVDLGSMANQLRGFRESESFETEAGETFELVTEILDLKLEENSIAGVYSKDFVERSVFRRETSEAPSTEEARFWIGPLDDKVFMIVIAPSGAGGGKKLLTSHVANKLSQIFYGRIGAIVEVRISHDTLRDLHESNPQATKLIWFDNVDIPGVDKLCLSGSALADTQLYHDNLQHGNIWYVVFEAQKRSIVVGITRDCTVTLFSKSTIDEFTDYVVEDLLKLVE